MPNPQHKEMMKYPLRSLARHAVMGLLLSCLCSGCATWAKHGVLLDSRTVRVLVLPVQTDVPVKRLRDIRTLPEDWVASTNEQALVDLEMRNVAEQVGQLIHAGLDRSYFFEPIPNNQL
ncbi:MAG: hypothetical protein K9M54_07255 [Kiritimatiellales bacterium]|nr:hypothetical protein [Kiritimatiellales bacterium]MCF7863653.1 hypothetical protein [Kiritimatiellales bacterium]